MSESPIRAHAGTVAELKERLDAERRGRPFLVYRDEGGAQRLVELEGERRRLTVGRHPDSDLALEWDRHVSRLHAELELAGGEWTVVDDGLSQNGTFVNGARIHGRRRLRDGDAVRFGGTVAAFVRPDESRSERTADAGETALPELSPSRRRVLVALCRPVGGSEFAAPATNARIAEELHLSVDTVKGHLRALFELFGIADLPHNRKRAELAWRAVRAGIVSGRELER